jgi:peptidoglycan hydrolase-like protein with peptidoglycan-binding domain
VSGNDRLQKCAQLAPSHGQPNEPASPHVRLIQEALRQVDNADIPLSDTNYGEKTTKAVVAFKTKKNLFTRGTRSIDPIVAIGTITRA